MTSSETPYHRANRHDRYLPERTSAMLPSQHDMGEPIFDWGSSSHRVLLQSVHRNHHRVMAMEEDSFIVRRPRHEVLDKADCRITVEWIASSRCLAAELADVSRQGLKLILDANMPNDARIRLCLEQPANRFSVTLPVTVRWSRLEDDGRWGVGCVFDRELSWELMGELFLNGILSVDTMSAATLSADRG